MALELARPARRRLHLFTALWIGLALAAQAQVAVWAQSGIHVVEAPAPVYDFGGSIAFHLTAESTAAITAATLFINTGGPAPAMWHSEPFTPANHVTAAVSFELAVNRLPPFGPVSYWWQVDDSAGQRLKTQPASFTYDDNRFAWRTVTSGSVTVHWYRGDTSFGQNAADIATSALPAITRDVRAPLPEHVNIYIYATDNDVQSALGRVGVAYANGHADPKLGVVIVSVAPDLRASYNLQIQIPHEITHVLIYRATAGNYARVPYWFNEGLAVMHQAQRDSTFPALLAAARDSRQFLSLGSLCAPFSPASVSLAYAESESAVRFIRDHYGAEGINRLLAAYAGGAGCAAGVQSGLGLSLDQLDSDWQQNLAPPPETVQQRAQALAPWLLLAALVLISPVTFLLVAFRDRRPGETAVGDPR
jgi:hypothetical protein